MPLGPPLPVLKGRSIECRRAQQPTHSTHSRFPIRCTFLNRVFVAHLSNNRSIFTPPTSASLDPLRSPDSRPLTPRPIFCIIQGTCSLQFLYCRSALLPCCRPPLSSNRPYLSQSHSTTTTFRVQSNPTRMPALEPLTHCPYRTPTRPPPTPSALCISTPCQPKPLPCEYSLSAV
jgi:hypothetical protein